MLKFLKKSQSSAWSALEYFCYPLLVFITTPLFLKYMGVENFGRWMLLNAMVGFAGVMNGGTGAAITKSVSSCQVNDPEKKTQKSIISSSLVIAIIGGAAILLIISFFFYFFGDHLFYRMGGTSVVFPIALFAGVIAWIEQIDNIFVATIRGMQRFRVNANIEIISRVFQISVALVVVFLFQQQFLLYLTFVLFSLIKLLLRTQSVVSLLGALSLKLDISRVGDLFSYAKWGWVQALGALFFGVFDRLLVGSLLGSSSLSFYTIVSQLPQQLHAISVAIFSVIFPKISKIQSKNKASLVSQAIKKLVLINIVFSTSFALLLMFFGKKILVVWLGAIDVDNLYLLMQLITVAYWLMSVNVTPHYVLMSRGYIRFLALTNVMAGFVSMFLMYILAAGYGLQGVGFSRIFYGLVICLNLIPLIKEVKNRRAMESRWVR